MNKYTFYKLKELKLSGMAEEYERQLNAENIEDFTFEQRFTLLVDTEYDRRQNNKIEYLIKNAFFSEQGASIHSISYYKDRNLDKELITEISTNNYIAKGRNIIITGASGSGKSYLANAFGVNACKSRISTKYIRLPELLGEFEMAKIQNNYQKIINKYIKTKVLIIDEWMLVPLNSSEQQHLLEVFEKRYYEGSTILCSQFSVEAWHKKLGGSALADAIMDRITPNAIKIHIEGDRSMRTRNYE